MKTTIAVAFLSLGLVFITTIGLGQSYTITDLGALSGASSSLGADVNTSGQVTGSSPLKGSHAFLYSAGTGMVDLGTLPGDSGSAGNGINASGQVTGVSSGQTSHAFLYSPGTGMVDLGTLPGGVSYSVGERVNASGQVTGYAFTTSSTYHAFLYSAGSGMTDLGTLPGDDSSVGQGINASGQVTGFSATTSGTYQQHAFLYSAGTGMVDLGTLPGDSGSAGSGINASGQVTGSSNINASGQASHAFLYSAATGMLDLNTVLPSGSGWTLNAATAINDAGQITGYGTNPNGATHAFLLSPVNTLPSKTLVVLVHGWCSDPSSFNNLGSLLSSSAGFVMADPFDYSQFTRVLVTGQMGLSIEELASLFAAHVRNQLKAHPEAIQVDVVAHSMGGLIVRAWMAGATSIPVPYNGEIRRLVLIGTPNFGVSSAQIGQYAYAVWLASLLTVSCSGTQANEMQFGSPFLMNLYDRWNSFEATSTHALHPEDLLFIAGTQGSWFPPGNECSNLSGCDDGVVDISSAVLPKLNNIRYVPYKHSSSVRFPTTGLTINGVNTTQHKTYLLIKTFLGSGAVLTQCCGTATVDYQPPHLRGSPRSNIGLLVLRLREPNNQPVSSLFAPRFSFSPQLLPPLDYFPWWNRASGVATLTGVRAGSYDIGVRIGLHTGSIRTTVNTAQPNVPPPTIIK